MADDKNKPKKLIKAQHTGVIRKNKNDVAATKVHAKHGITGDGPKKTKFMRVKKGA
jgi:hypothetical protein